SLSLSAPGTESFANALASMYTSASMPGETGPVASASLGSAIENGGRERLGQLWHPASKCRTATERLSVCGTGRHQSRDGLASIRNCDFVPLSNLSNQCRQVLPRFTYSCFFHPAIVLHVALSCNCLLRLLCRRRSRATAPFWNNQLWIRITPALHVRRQVANVADGEHRYGTVGLYTDYGQTRMCD